MFRYRDQAWQIGLLLVLVAFPSMLNAAECFPEQTKTATMAMGLGDNLKSNLYITKNDKNEWIINEITGINSLRISALEQGMYNSALFRNKPIPDNVSPQINYDLMVAKFEKELSTDFKGEEYQLLIVAVIKKRSGENLNAEETKLFDDAQGRYKNFVSNAIISSISFREYIIFQNDYAERKNLAQEILNNFELHPEKTFSIEQHGQGFYAGRSSSKFNLQIA